MTLNLLSRVVAAAAVISVAVGCGRRGDEAATDPAPVIRVAYTSEPDVDDLASFVAHRSLEAQGIDVRPTFYAQPELAAEALARGDAEIGLGGVALFWRATTRGADLVTVMEHSANLHLLAAREGATTCDRLGGARLGLHSAGAIGTAFVNRWLGYACGATRPVRIFIPGSAARAAALAAGVLDAAALERFDFVGLQGKYPGRFRAVVDFGEWLPQIAATGVQASRRFLTSHPDLARAYLRARLLANRRITEDEAVAIAEATHWPGLSALPADALPANLRARIWRTDGGLTIEGARQTLAFFVEAGDLPSGLSVEQVVDLSLLYALRAELGLAAAAVPPRLP